MSLEATLVVAGVIFSIGVFGILTRKNLIMLVMAIELMFNAVVLAAVGATRFAVPFALSAGTETIEEGARFVLTGHILAIFVVAVAAVETALFLALIFAIYKQYGTLNLSNASELKG